MLNALHFDSELLLVLLYNPLYVVLVLVEFFKCKLLGLSKIFALAL